MKTDCLSSATNKLILSDGTRKQTAFRDVAPYKVSSHTVYPKRGKKRRVILVFAAFLLTAH